MSIGRGHISLADRAGVRPNIAPGYRDVQRQVAATVRGVGRRIGRSRAGAGMGSDSLRERHRATSECYFAELAGYETPGDSSTAWVGALSHVTPPGLTNTRAIVYQPRATWEG